MNKEKIIDWIIYICIVALMGLTLIFKSDLSTILLMYSIGSLIIGILSVISSKQYGIILIVVSLSILTTYILYKNGTLNIAKSLTFMICLSVILILLSTIVTSLITLLKLKKVYSMTVEGEVVDLIKEPNTKKEYYLPVYLYKVGKVEYEINGLCYIKKNIPQIGSKIQLSIDPNQPSEVYFFPSKFEYIKNLVGSILFITVCVVILIKIF